MRYATPSERTWGAISHLAEVLPHTTLADLWAAARALNRWGRHSLAAEVRQAISDIAKYGWPR